MPGSRSARRFRGSNGAHQPQDIVLEFDELDRSRVGMLDAEQVETRAKFIRMVGQNGPQSPADPIANDCITDRSTNCVPNIGCNLVISGQGSPSQPAHTAIASSASVRQRIE